MFEESVSLWVAIVSGVIMALVGLYGLAHTMQQRRLQQRQRLLDAAAIAVRRTEATMVRPILHSRMISILEELSGARRGGEDPLLFRMRLYCRLLREMGLREDEKRTAATTAEGHLLRHLRSMPHPPLRVATERQRQEHAGLMRECLEQSYNLRPRPTAELVHNLAYFLRGVPGAGEGGPLVTEGATATYLCASLASSIGAGPRRTSLGVD